jgi:hypothetical protein
MNDRMKAASCAAARMPVIADARARSSASYFEALQSIAVGPSVDLQGNCATVAGNDYAGILDYSNGAGNDRYGLCWGDP